MGIFLLIIVVLAAGIWLGFMIGFSKTLREAAHLANRPSYRPIIGRLLIGLGCTCQFVGLIAALHSWNFLRTSQSTTGIVIEMRAREDRETQSVGYAPTVEFRTPQGTTHRIQSDFFAYPPLHVVGDVVPVRFQPGSPEKARIDRFAYHWGLTAIIAPMGLLQLVIGFVLLRWPMIRARFSRKP